MHIQDEKCFAQAPQTAQGVQRQGADVILKDHCIRLEAVQFGRYKPLGAQHPVNQPRIAHGLQRSRQA
ncbi:hypothetical protein D3C81_1551270 [compost metagenome]